MTLEMTNITTNFMLVGVGGQGTILASNILAELGVRLGYDVKKAEVHGMSQRGGSVVSHLRWGKQVFAPIVSKGEVDILLAFEELEAARYIDQLKPGGLVVINEYQIRPVTVSSGKAVYPSKEVLQGMIARATDNAHWVQGAALAEQLGNAKVANVVVLGTLSRLLDMPSADWEEAIKVLVPPKLLALNLKAFQAGRDAL